MMIHRNLPEGGILMLGITKSSGVRSAVGRTSGAMLGLGLVCLGMIACGADAPPLSELELRDALRADPAILAQLGASDCQQLAGRMEQAREQPEPDDAPMPTAGGPSQLVQTLDGQRSQHGKDALVLGRLTPQAGAVTLAAATVTPGSAPPPPLWLLNTPDRSADANVAAREQLALAGRAGRILAALQQKTGANTLVRVTQWPIAVVEHEGTLFVNAAWLIALSALETPAAAGAGPGTVSAAIPQSGLKARDYGFNPYNLPGSIDTCRQIVADACQCAAGGSCNHTPLDASFANAQEECEWVSQSPSINASGLCAYAMSQISSVRSCIVASGACGALGTRADAIKALQTPACLSAIDACLVDTTSAGNSTPPSSGRSCAEACGEEFGKALGASCQKSCDKSCDSCKANNSCKGPTCNNKTCTLAAPQHEEADPVAVFGMALLYLLSPIGYVLARVGRQS